MTEIFSAGVVAPILTAVPASAPGSRDPATMSVLQQPGSHDIMMRRILNPIARKPVTQFATPPWNAVGLLNLAMHGQPVTIGTGFMCAPDVFLTAGHNLTAKTFDAGGVWLAYDAQKNPTPQITIRSRAWHASLDLAVLILAVNHPAVLKISSSTGTPVEIAGYGFPYPNGTLCLSAGVGAVTGSNGVSLGYGINTQDGDSGAPVLATTATGAMTVVAVHTTAQGSLPASNFGTLLTPTALAGVNQLIAFARSQIGD